MQAGWPYWNSALLAPRFLATAFVAGPAFILLAMRAVRTQTGFPITPGPARTLVQIIRVAMVANLIMLASELFTAFYAGGGHASAVKYLFFGDHGKHGLVPLIWAAVALNFGGTALFFAPAALDRGTTRIAACLMVVVGIWIEKGMGLIVPGFVPSALHEVVEYAPSLTEWKVTVGIWAFGLIIFTVGLKLAVAVFTDELRDPGAAKADNVAPVTSVTREQTATVHGVSGSCPRGVSGRPFSRLVPRNVTVLAGRIVRLVG